MGKQVLFQRDKTKDNKENTQFIAAVATSTTTWFVRQVDLRTVCHLDEYSSDHNDSEPFQLQHTGVQFLVWSFLIWSARLSDREYGVSVVGITTVIPTA